MAELKTEYTDAKLVRHRVEHSVVSGEEKPDREQLVEELVAALTDKRRRISA